MKCHIVGISEMFRTCSEGFRISGKNVCGDSDITSRCGLAGKAFRPSGGRIVLTTQERVSSTSFRKQGARCGASPHFKGFPKSGILFGGSHDRVPCFFFLGLAWALE